MQMLKFCGAILLFLLLATGYCHASSGEPADHEEAVAEEQIILMPMLEMPKVGDVAPPFEILSLEGKSYSLKKEAEGKVVSLVFWSLFCAPCRRSMPVLNDLYRELRGKDFEIVAVNMDGERMLDGVKSYAAEEHLEFPILMDEYDGESLKVADPYGVQGTPTIFIIDRGGLVTFSKVGDLEREQLKKLIMRELEGKPLEEETE